MRFYVLSAVFSAFFVCPAMASEPCNKEITPAGNCQVHCFSQDGQAAAFCYGSSDLCEEGQRGTCLQQISTDKNCWQFSYISCNATTCITERLKFPAGC